MGFYIFLCILVTSLIIAFSAEFLINNDFDCNCADSVINMSYIDCKYALSTVIFSNNFKLTYIVNKTLIFQNETKEIKIKKSCIKVYYKYDKFLSEFDPHHYIMLKPKNIITLIGYKFILHSYRKKLNKNISERTIYNIFD